MARSLIGAATSRGGLKTDWGARAGTSGAGAGAGAGAGTGAGAGAGGAAGTAATTGSFAGADGGAPWRRARSCSARSRALKKVLMGRGAGARTERGSAWPHWI
ncbi:MAG: hypothetical protein DMD96_31040 [Candidatus Rokuibacteriota bacterium]|nr:MAG: hypothetical protein DMD96_31040 [Candidatus Rokubacteria bacterium]